MPLGLLPANRRSLVRIFSVCAIGTAYLGRLLVSILGKSDDPGATSVSLSSIITDVCEREDAIVRASIVNMRKPLRAFIEEQVRVREASRGILFAFQVVLAPAREPRRHRCDLEDEKYEAKTNDLPGRRERSATMRTDG